MIVGAHNPVPHAKNLARIVVSTTVASGSVERIVCRVENLVSCNANTRNAKKTVEMIAVVILAMNHVQRNSVVDIRVLACVVNPALLSAGSATRKMSQRFSLVTKMNQMQDSYFLKSVLTLLK